MTLPKGFGSGGGGGASSADVEKMIGRRVENMTGMITASYLAAWLATFGGTAAGYFVYPWAYPNTKWTLCIYRPDHCRSNWLSLLC